MKSLRVVVLVCVFCLVLMPLLITKGHAGRESIGNKKLGVAPPKAAMFVPGPVGAQQQAISSGPQADAGPVSPEVYQRLGLGSAAGAPASKSSGISPQANIPINMAANSAFSTAIATNIGTGFLETDTLGDWDGREDDTADHGGKVMDATNVPAGVSSNPNFFLTRVAFSEHTIANGFNEDVVYTGDSVGNVYVASTTNITNAAPTPTVLQINLPTVLNAFGTLNSNNSIVVTGLAVSPVCDLGSFSAVNGAFATDFPANTIGEILYVTYEDTSGGFRLNANGTLVRSGLLAFPISDVPTPGAAAPPGRLSATGFPVTVGGSFGVAFSTFSNLAGCAVDDDGSVYFQQVDLSQFTGGNIVKITSADNATRQDRSLATSGFLTITTLNPTAGNYGTSSGPANQVNQYTNYSGTSTFMGNVISISTGPGNVLYAAVARSQNPADDGPTQATEGLFVNPASVGATPSMIATFADAKGQFDRASSPDASNPTLKGIIPVADGFADPVPGTSINWRAFVLGNGPDTRAASGASAATFGTPANTLKLDMAIDYSLYSGLSVDEQGTAYVISGGAPSGLGSNPSSSRGEVLSFEDLKPADRRADYIDFRGDLPPNPPLSGGNVGDGDSDRFDHIFYVAPMDISTLTPAGLSGLSRGFLRYTNRLAPNAISSTVTLGQTGGQPTLGDDATTNAVIRFDDLDPGHQVAGGDDLVSPFRGDNDGGAGTPAIADPNAGGFEFTFGGPVGTAGCVWNGFFLNSNGNITFGVGDTANISSDIGLRSGPPRIAPAWADLNPNSRAGGFTGTFPVQAVGFVGVNAFKVRYINVPEFGYETAVTQNPGGSGQTNNFSITLYDDGTGIDENANQPLNPANPIGNNAVPFDLQEGPTDLRFVGVSTPDGTTLVGEPPRLDGSGLHTFTYGRMDLIVTSGNPVTTGYSVGNLAATNPPGLCEIDLGSAAVSADSGFGNIQGPIESYWPTFIGDGSEPEVHEFFHNGIAGAVDSGTGVITVSQPDFDLRFEGNGDATPAGQIQASDVNRDRVGFFGSSCAPPANPVIALVKPGAFQTTPGTSAASLINAYAPVTVNLIGFGFIPNNVTTICPSSTGDGAQPDIVVPTARPGKTVSTSVVVNVDTNSDGVVDTPVSLTNVTPVSRNLATATLAPLPNASGSGPGSPFPFLATGGVINFTTTTTFTAADNNVFGAFTRTGVGVIDSGARAPVVVSSAPSSGDSSLVQNLTITGFDFQYQTSTQNPTGPAGLRPFTVTSVFAVQRDNPSNIINATTFNVLNNTTINATFNFNNALVGKQFLIFAQNAAGPSRNALAPPGGASPAGNEQGNLIVFTVIDTTPPTITCPSNVSVNAAPGATSAIATFPDPTHVTDNQPGVTFSCNRTSGSSFNVGSTTVTCTATDTSNNVSSCNFNVNVVGQNSMHLGAATYSGNEAGCNSVAFTVQRDNGSASGTSSIDVVTSDGTAVQKSDYEFTSATVTFNPGETSKSFSVPLNDDGFVEGPQTFTLTLSNPQNGVAGNGPQIATVTINDDDLVAPPGNINDTPSVFVCQHYHDFLNRDPDTAGANFWANQITACGVDPACISTTRVNVSAAFFLSIEFQETGGDVLRVQRAAFGRRSDQPLTRYPFAQFMRDAQQVGRGVIVGQAGFQAVLDANKAAYVTQIVSSSAFITAFPTSQTAAQFVDALYTSAGVAPSSGDRTAAISAFGAGGTSGRAAALQSVADSTSMRNGDFNISFVLMEYYGYLRRNPTDAPDGNDTGYQFWLGKLNSFGGDYIKAEMVKAFITSSEYRQRTGP